MSEPIETPELDGFLADKWAWQQYEPLAQAFLRAAFESDANGLERSPHMVTLFEGLIGMQVEANVLRDAKGLISNVLFGGTADCARKLRDIFSTEKNDVPASSDQKSTEVSAEVSELKRLLAGGPEATYGPRFLQLVGRQLSLVGFLLYGVGGLAREANLLAKTPWPPVPTAPNVVGDGPASGT